MADKKDFRKGAAAQFFGNDGAEPEQPAAQIQQPAAQAKRKPFQLDTEERQRRALANAEYFAKRKTQPRERPDWRESRSKRVNLVMKPSVYENALFVADEKEISFNHLAELALIEYVENHLDDLNEESQG